MPFSIVEQFCEGKSADGYTEDRIIRSENHFGVLDGSRGPADVGKEIITSVLDTARDYLQSMPADITHEIMAAELDLICKDHKTAAGTADFRRTGGFVYCLYSQHHNEIWRVGDCKFNNCGTENAAMFKAEEICAAARSMIIQSKLNDGQSVDEIMTGSDYPSLIDELLEYEARFLNVPSEQLGFGAVMGDGVPAEYVETMPAAPRRLVISSDGYPNLFPTLEATEASLTAMLDKDPLCIGENMQCKGLGPNLRSFDDRSYISADLTR